MTDVTAKVERAVARFERVAQQLDQRAGPSQDAARRERKRLNAGLGRTAVRVAVTIALIWLATIVLGLVIHPVGMFGFLGALILSLVVAGVLIKRGGRSAAPTPPSADLPNAAMVDRFDSYLYRTRAALPPPARTVLDAINQELSPLKQTLSRIDAIDPAAQDARRLMSVHLPGLIDRYMNVPAAYRQEVDGEGKTVDQRLVEGLEAGRSALGDVSERLARTQVAALETQGRFIQSRYGDETIEQ